MWGGSIKTEFDKTGTFRGYIGPERDATTLIATGKVDDGTYR
jgi:hypothetical protein